MTQDLRHTSPLLGCRFDPSGRFVFAGAQDNAVVRFELATGRKTILSGHRSWIRAFAFQGQRVFSADYNGKIMVWPLAAENPTAEHTINAHRGFVRALAISPDGRLLAICGNDNRVRLWSTSDFALSRDLGGHQWHVYNVAFHPTGQYLISADLHGVVKQWNLADGTETRTMDCSVLFKYDTNFRADHGGIRSMCFNRDGTSLACTGITNVSNAFAGIGNPAVVLLDWQSGARTQILRPQPNFQGTGWGVIWHPAGFLAAAGGGSGGALWFWRPDQVNSFHTIALPSQARDLDMDVEERRLAVPFFDGAVRIYDLAPPM
jgi:WD40 repeat protein